MTWRKALFLLRLLNLYLALLAVVWFGYLMWNATQPRDIICSAVASNELYCESIKQP